MSLSCHHYIMGSRVGSIQVRQVAQLHFCSSNLHCHLNKLSSSPLYHQHLHPQLIIFHYRPQTSPRHLHFLNYANRNVWRRPTPHSGMIKADNDNEEVVVAACLPVYSSYVSYIELAMHYRLCKPAKESQIMF